MAVPRLIARRLAPALALSCLTAPVVAMPSPAAAASKGTVSGTITGALPATGRGEASVRAYDVDTGELAGFDVVSRRGAFSLRLPSGGYVLVASSVRDRAVLSERLVPVSLRSGQRRTGVRIAATRVKARPTGAATPPTATGALAPLTPNAELSYEVADLTGDSAARATLGRGLPALLAGDLRGQESCNAVQVAGDRALRIITSTSRLKRSKEFASSTKIRRKLTSPRLTIEGNVGKGADDAHSAFTIRIVETSTGRVVDTLNGAVRNRGKGLFTDERRVAAVLAERLCQRPRTYKVALALSARGEYTAYNSTARIASTVTARASTNEPYAAWKGAESFTWTDNVFRSRVTGCPASAIYPGTGSWGATVTVRSSAEAQVDLDLTTAEYTGFSTADFDCPNDIASLTKAPGPLLSLTQPRSFTLPLGGGTGTIDSTLTLPTGGYLRTGTVTLTPVWSHTLPGT